jgi:hypothetical protein
MATEPQVLVVDFLRARLTDYNSVSRSGAQWIYPDIPLTAVLSKNNFPRVGIKAIRQNSRLAGCGSNDLITDIIFEIKVYTYEDATVTVGAVKRTNAKLAEIIARDVVSAFRQYWDTDTNLTRLKHNFVIHQNLATGYDTVIRKKDQKERRIYTHTIEIEMRGVNLGEE